MASPSAPQVSVESRSIRNPRRRQRKDSEEGASLRQQPQRKKSKLSKDGDAAVINGNGFPNGTVKANGYLQCVARSREPSLQLQDIPVRGKKPSRSTRDSKGDGAVILTQNSNYAVKQLPGLPDAVRTLGTAEFRGSVHSVARAALALTHNQAYIWDYTSSLSSPPTRTVNLPQSSGPSDALPFGCLTYRSSLSILGLVVVAPTSGKITYWEDVDGAESLSLFSKRQHGLEGSVSLFSGESVADVVSAEHAGYVLVLSSGRLAQVTLQDPQGRPAVRTQILRSTTSSGGFLGGLKVVFGGGAWRKDVIAVKARQLVRGFVDVIVAAEGTVFQQWSLSWSGQYHLKAELDARTELTTALEEVMTPDSKGQQQEVRVVDFEYMPQRVGGSEISFRGEDRKTELLVLASMRTESSLAYVLVSIDITGDSLFVARVIRLHTYAAPLKKTQKWRPRLLLPNPHHTAFVIFSQAIVVASVVVPQNSPNMQLMLEIDRLPEPFQDTVCFREEVNLEVLGCGPENASEHSRQASCIVFVRGFGVVRVVAEEPATDPAGIEQARITPKSRIEQAIFYGPLPSNILDFSRKSEISFSLQEVEDAALQVSGEIMKSASAFIPKIAASMDQQLAQRADALKNLARHLRDNYPPLSKAARWKLMWDGEKMAAGRAIWKVVDAQLKEGKYNGRRNHERLLVDLLMECMHEDVRTPATPENLGELDEIRFWFTKDLDRMQTFIAWCFNTVRVAYQEGTKDHPTVMRFINEAGDCVLAGMETAFSFRQDNKELYGLSSEIIVDGVLQEGYEGLAEPWTSTYQVCKNILELTNFAREMAARVGEEHDLTVLHVDKIAVENVRLVELVCKIHSERWRWCSASDNEKIRAYGQGVRQEAKDIRKRLISSLPKIGQSGPGMDLAEKYRDMHTLVDLVIGESAYLLGEGTDPAATPDEIQRINEQLQTLQNRLKSYYEKFGEEWATALFSRYVANGHTSALFAECKGYEEFVTNYLDSTAGCKKLGWINSVVNERKFTKAGETLLQIAITEETNLWNKKVECSLSKLAFMALEKNDGDLASVKSSEKTTNDQLKLVRIQETLYAHMKPSWYNALDQKAAVDIAMGHYGRETTKNTPALRQLLERAFEALTNSYAMEAEQLIDALTLMDQVQSVSPEDDISGQEYFMALQALKSSGLATKQRDHFDTTLKIIWRRCLLRDDWEVMNQTGKKADEATQKELEGTILFKTIKLGLSRGLFEDPHGVQLVPPGRLLTAGTEPSSLQQRFPEVDLQRPIAADMSHESTILSHLLSSTRMEFWFTACKNHATKVTQQEKEEEKTRKQTEKGIERDLNEADENGLSNGLWGTPQDLVDGQFGDEQSEGGVAEDEEKQMLMLEEDVAMDSSQQVIGRASEPREQRA